MECLKLEQAITDTKIASSNSTETTQPSTMNVLINAYDDYHDVLEFMDVVTNLTSVFVELYIQIFISYFVIYF